MHQPYSSSHNDVNFVVLGFSSLLEDPCQAVFEEPSDLASFSLLSGFTYSRCAGCLKLVFSLALRGMRNVVHIVRLVTVSEVTLPLCTYFPLLALTLFSANLVQLENLIMLLCEAACLARSEGTFSDTEHWGSSGDFWDLLLTATQTLFFWNDSSLLLMLRSKKDGNKGNVFATQKMEITGKPEMKDKQRMQAWEVLLCSPVSQTI